MDFDGHLRIKLAVTSIVVALVATVMGFTVGTTGMGGFAVIVATAALVWWMAKGTTYWWLPIPFFLSLGGVCQLRVKVYPIEIALMFSVATLLPGLAIKWYKMHQQRGGLPAWTSALTWYLIIHCVVSICTVGLSDSSGMGSVLRVYFNALWPLGFIYVFHHFGRSEQVWLVLPAMYCATIIRLVIGLVVHFTGVELSIPFVNYLPAASSSEIQGFAVQDLRFSGLAMIGLSLACLPIARSLPRQTFHVLMLFAGVASISLGGGRAAIIYALFYPFVFLIIYRKFKLIATFTMCLAGLIGFVNISPEALDRLPSSAQRSLGILIVRGDLTAGQQLSSQSDLFHKRFTQEGFHRWSQNIKTVAFGTGVQPPDSDLSYDDPYGNFDNWLEYMVKNAANVGAYEAALWSILAVTGLTGLIFYILLLWGLVRDVAKDLLRARINSKAQAIAYLGVTQLLITVAFCWTAGGFPNMEIFLLYLANTASFDKSRLQDGPRKTRVVSSKRPTNRFSVKRPAILPR